MLFAAVVSFVFMLAQVECYSNVRLSQTSRMKTSLNWAIHDAAEKGDFATVFDIIEKDPQMVSKIDIDGQIPLHFAAKFGHVDLARYLIDKGPGYVNFFNIRYRTPLHWACSYAGYGGYEGCEEIAYMLVRAGGDLKFDNKDRCTPLWYAEKSPLGKSFAKNLKEYAKGIDVRPVDIGMDRVYWG